MSISDMIAGGGGALVLLLCLIQIAPIRIDPWTWIAHQIGRAINKEVMHEVGELRKSVTDVKNDLDETKATTSRTRILRFNDEILQGTKHTKEHFDQILVDIDQYRKYCDSHRNFENGKAVSSIRNIIRVYDACMRDGSFL